MTKLEELMRAALSATDTKRQVALNILKGGAEAERSTAQSLRVEPYVGTKEVAEFLRVSTRSVWRWRVPGHKLGSLTRFRLSEVAAYMESEEFRAREEELRAARAAAVGRKGK